MSGYLTVNEINNLIRANTSKNQTCTSIGDSLSSNTENSASKMPRLIILHLKKLMMKGIVYQVWKVVVPLHTGNTKTRNNEFKSRHRNGARNGISEVL